jgi:predicted DNA-binding transcriptional regulator AlpA
MNISIPIEEEIKQAIAKAIEPYLIAINNRLEELTFNKPGPMLISIDEVSSMLGISRATIYNRINSDNNFPTPKKEGKSTMFKYTDIRDYVDSL